MASLSFPYAILPSIEERGADIDYDNEDGANTVHRSILNLSENKHYEWKNMFKGNPGAWCVGSSHDWLVLLDTNGYPFLFNPSSSTFISLPNFPHSFIHPLSNSDFVEYSRKTFVSKAVLMSFPSTSESVVVIIYDCSYKLAFCKHATWFKLSDAKHSYNDIVFKNNVLYSLSRDGFLEGWDFSRQTPIKIFDIKPTMEINREEEGEFLSDQFSSQLYLVISEEEFLLVRRYIGNFVNKDGEVVYEGYYDDDAPCPYRTKHFVVYKLDVIHNKWEKKTSLNDQVLFLGTNESTSLPAKSFSGCEANSIYFTDDRWEEMNMDYTYGGHDWGVFNLENSSIKLLSPYEDKMNPPPIWVVPSFDHFLGVSS